MDNHSGHVMTLANSIIGVSILAMPYCFKQCGIVLSVLMLLISSVISRLACHFLVKSAIIARRKTFEYLAFHIFGSMGKLAIEIGIIGFLVGTCIAFFVVMGDLGPEIIAEMTGIYTTNTMRTSILMALALFCVLPLGLLRNVDSLNGVSRATIGFYCCLVLKIVFEAVPHIFSGDWYSKVIFWRPEGILQCLPIFSMALFCQTQLFEIYQALQNATLEKMNNVVRVAVNICTLVYLFVGVFGYIAFSHKPFTGNILLSFSPSLMTDVIKIGFVLSVAFSFPLVIFPCRASLYSLLYKEGYSLHEGMSNYIPEGKFKGLTMFIVFLSLIIGIMIPNIELVLGLVGSTIGVMICVLFPVTSFICISPKNTNERILAQLMLMVGVFVMVLGTYKNLYTLDKLEPNTVTISSFKNLEQLDLNVAKAMDKIEDTKDFIEKATTVKIANIEKSNDKVEKVKIDVTTLKIMEDVKEVRHEPPQPIEPQEEVEEVKKIEVKEENAAKPSLPPVEVDKDKKIPVEEDKLAKSRETVNKSKVEQKNDEVDVEAIKKEDREVELQEKEKIKAGDTNQVLIDTIQKQNEVQKEIVEQQKKLIEVIQSQQKNVQANDIHKVHEEKVKAMKQIESIALKAIEKISGGKDSNVAVDLEKHIEAKIEQDAKQHQGLNEGKNEVPKTQNQDEKLNSLENKKLLVDIKSEQEAKKAKDLPDVVVAQANLVNLDQGLEDKNNIADSNKKDIQGQKDKKEVPEIRNVIIEEKKQDQEDTVLNADIELGKKEEKDEVVNVDKKMEGEDDKNPSLVASNIEVKNNPVIPVKNNDIPTIGNINSANNTAPLFLKLGKSEQKVVDTDLKRMVPLPIAMSNNLLKESNLSKVDVAVENQLLSGKDESPVNKEELQVIRRDILMLKSRRR